MPKKEATAISIKPLEEGHVKITVRGTAPLLVHAWDDKAIGMIKDKQAGKTKKARETRDPEREMNAARYCVVPDETGRYVETEFDNGKAVDAFKATAFKAAMIRAGKLLGYTMTDLKCRIACHCLYTGLYRISDTPIPMRTMSSCNSGGFAFEYGRPAPSRIGTNSFSTQKTHFKSVIVYPSNFPARIMAALNAVDLNASTAFSLSNSVSTYRPVSSWITQ